MSRCSRFHARCGVNPIDTRVRVGGPGFLAIIAGSKVCSLLSTTSRAAPSPVARCAERTSAPPRSLGHAETAAIGHGRNRQGQTCLPRTLVWRPAGWHGFDGESGATNACSGGRSHLLLESSEAGCGESRPGNRRDRRSPAARSPAIRPSRRLVAHRVLGGSPEQSPPQRWPGRDLTKVWQLARRCETASGYVDPQRRAPTPARWES